MRSRRFERAYNLNKLGKPIYRWEWGMTPMTINAYANFSMGEIVFPAAILQPPFFDPAADPAVNYGGIGAVIGHEISHHFDDQGRKYDASGRLTEWWTQGDVTRFNALTDQLVKQYDAYQPLPGQNVSGRLTLGENIGDLAGLTVAALAVPSAMAYGQLAGLSPVNGLYALLLPTVAYVLLGSSRRLVIGPEGATSTLVAAAVLLASAAAIAGAI